MPYTLQEQREHEAQRTGFEVFAKARRLLLTLCPLVSCGLMYDNVYTELAWVAYRTGFTGGVTFAELADGDDEVNPDV